MQRFTRYTTRAMFLIITLLCVGLAWHATRTRARQRLICDQLVDYHLVSTHWQAWETDPQQRAIVTAMVDDLPSETASTAKFLRPDGRFEDGAAANGFEKQLLTQWSDTPATRATSATETAERHSFVDGSLVYYKAIRAKKSCAMCHTPFGGKPLRNGVLLAIAKIELRK